jgi:ABC-2 type transport system permease protein
MKRQLTALIRKDLKIFRSDRRALIVSFAVPALLALLFGMAFRGGSSGPAHVNVRIVDLDGSAGSQRLAAALTGHPLLRAQPATRDEAEALVRRGKVDVALVIPAGFVAAAAAGAHPTIEVLADPTARVEAGVAQGALAQVAPQALGPDLGADYVKCAGQGEPFTTSVKGIGGGNLLFDGGAHALAGMGIQFILIGGLDAAVNLLNERQRGILRRLRAAPLGRAVLVGSRLVSGALIALLVLIALYAFGKLTMGVAIRGPMVGFALVAVSFALMASAFGLLVATFGKTPQATRGFGVFIILIASFLSGAWLPAFLFPAWMQTATLFVPTRWAVDGLDAMSWRGLGLDAALAPAGVLLGSALVLGVWAAMRFRWDD